MNQNLLEDVGNRLLVYRQGGYPGEDILLFLFLYFIAYSGQQVEKFDEELTRYRRQMAALCGR